MRLHLAFVALVACVPLHRDNSQHIGRLCVDREYAYETGYNAGLERHGLDTSWVSRCAPERMEAIRTAYRSGYEQGIANAPIVVKGRYDHTVRGTHGVHHRSSSSWSAASSSDCTFSSDCGEGRTCRSGVCYGHGWAGDACVFSSDCSSNDCNHSMKTCR